jgi:LacI family transcriptional regulator
MLLVRSQEKNGRNSEKLRKATIKDIARLAQVSETTVSLSFRPGSRIGDETREKVLSIARELNYFPNTAARDLRAGRTKTIGFLINDITNPFYGYMVRTSEQVALERGYEVIFAESQWSPSHETNIINKMIQSRIEGMILCFSEKTEEAYNLVKQSGLPHVIVDTCPEYYEAPYVINDGWLAGYLSAQHLVEQKCERIAIFNARKALGSFSSINCMEQGFRHYFRENGMEFNDGNIIEAGLSIDSGKQAFREIRARGQFFDGIFCMNDLCAMGVMNEAFKEGMEAGRDYAIIGVDNNDVSDLEMISLTSIHIQYGEISRRATDYIINAIEKKSPGKIEETIAPRLVVRKSTCRTSSGISPSK